MPSFEKIASDEVQLRRAGAILAFLAGTILIAYWIGTQKIFFLYLVIQLAVLAYLILWAQRRAWVLILLGWSLTGPTAFFRVPISVRDFSVLATVCAYVVYRVVSGKEMRQKWRFLDAVIAINAVYLVFTFYLNPVGFAALGAETIGARPYFTILLALMGYWVIWRWPNSIKTVSRIPLFILAGSAAFTSLYALAYVFPSLPSRIPFLYAALNVGAYFGEIQVMKEAMGSQMVRYKELGGFGITLLLTLFAYIPSLALLNPLRPRFYALMVGAVCIFLTGFRNLMASGCALFGISVWLHQGFRKFLVTCAVGGALLLGLAFGQGRLYQLPFSVQRTLSLLPGNWDPMVTHDTEVSTEGRIQWWRQVFEEHLIRNRWFGDGFGASASDVALASRAGMSEMAFVTGALHSGPLTAIRYVGVVGLVLLYTLMIASAIYACRCVQRCKGTLLQPVAIFLAIQLIWIPIGYTFIFGSYNTDMPEQIFLVALLRLVMRMVENLPAHSNSTASTNATVASHTLKRTAA